MKKLIIIAVLMTMAMQMKALTPWTKGGFETGKYRNVFVEMGYKPSQVEGSVQRRVPWSQQGVFRGGRLHGLRLGHQES